MSTRLRALRADEEAMRRRSTWPRCCSAQYTVRCVMHSVQDTVQYTLHDIQFSNKRSTVRCEVGHLSVANSTRCSTQCSAQCSTQCSTQCSAQCSTQCSIQCSTQCSIQCSTQCSAVQSRPSHLSAANASSIIGDLDALSLDLRERGREGRREGGREGGREGQ